MACTDPIQLALALLKAPGASPECVTFHMAIPRPPVLSISQYALLFGLTFALEAPVYRAVVKNTRTYFGSWSLAGRVFLLNLLTHPMVCFGFPSFAARAGVEAGPSLALSEIFAILMEALVLNCVWEVAMTRALLGAFAANLVSWWLGTWIVVWFWT